MDSQLWILPIFKIVIPYLWGGGIMYLKNISLEESCSILECFGFRIPWYSTDINNIQQIEYSFFYLDTTTQIIYKYDITTQININFRKHNEGFGSSTNETVSHSLSLVLAISNQHYLPSTGCLLVARLSSFEKPCGYVQWIFYNQTLAFPM